jgi:RNA polymerase sigma-70 factor (ECF subfamily)
MVLHHLGFILLLLEIQKNQAVSSVHKNIIRHINQGDRKAFREVFEHFFNALAAFGYQYLQDQSEVEDMVQESFISFWEKRKDFDHINAVKSFLYTSVRNKCLNQLKHKAVMKKHESSLVYEIETDHSFAGQVIEEEAFNQLFTEIKALPESAREIMILALNGLKNQEIADELNISINTVKTQKKIAYSKLKDKLGARFANILLSIL